MKNKANEKITKDKFMVESNRAILIAGQGRQASARQIMERLADKLFKEDC